MAEPQGSWLSSDAFVACEHGLPCGHGWEGPPEQSPTALVQKFMVPETVMVEERLDGNFSTQENAMCLQFWAGGPQISCSVVAGLSTTQMLSSLGNAAQRLTDM